MNPLLGTTQVTGNGDRKAVGELCENVARVVFFIDGFGSEGATAPPYSTRWKITAAEKGEHVIFVRAYDAAGNYTDSKKVTITVK